MKIRLPRNRFLRWGICLASFGACGLLLALLLRWNLSRQSAAELEAEIAHLDATDPGWDWESFLANRVPVKDEENSFALLIKLQAVPGISRYDFDPNMDQWRIPPEAMPREVAEWAGEFVAERKEGILLARKLVGFPTGRHPIKYTPDFIGTMLPTVQDTRQVANLLMWDIRVNAQLGRFDTCIADLRAIRNAARSFGDEAFLIVTLVRIAIDTVGTRMAAEMLSQGEAPDAGLAILQKEYLEESREPILVQGIRSERATSLKMMQYFTQNSDVRGNLKMIQGLSRGGGGPGSGGSILDDLSDFFLAVQYPPVAKADQAYMLRLLTQVLDAVKLNGPERRAKLDEFEKALKAEVARDRSGIPNVRHLLTNLLVPAVEKVAEAESRWKASLRAAATGIAVERFRMANGRWPDKLEELVPKFMDRVEEDPYTSEPLIYKKLADGVVIYGVGKDGKDDGGDVNGKVETEGQPRGEYQVKAPTDVGFRLWNADKRGR